jgi:hypothetical protein
LIPDKARVGDDIAVFEGCPIPFVVRGYKDEKGSYVKIVGCAYVHGMMDGEAFELEPKGTFVVEVC